MDSRITDLEIKISYAEDLVDELNRIVFRQQQQIDLLATQIKELREQIKAAVIANGATVKGSMYQAVYVKGRDSWDTKALDGYAAAHPEIIQFRTTGNPSVTIRSVK